MPFSPLALKRFRATTNVEEDVEEMRAEQRAHSQEERISMLQLLRSRSLRMPLLIGDSTFQTNYYYLSILIL